MSMVNAVVATGIAFAFDIEKDDAFLLALLSASVSYIAVPAAMRLSVPEANDLLSNNYIFTVCEEHKIEKMLEKIRSFIDRYGGKCIISDTQVLLHAKGSR